MDASVSLPQDLPTSERTTRDESERAARAARADALDIERLELRAPARDLDDGRVRQVVATHADERKGDA